MAEQQRPPDSALEELEASVPNPEDVKVPEAPETLAPEMPVRLTVPGAGTTTAIVLTSPAVRARSLDKFSVEKWLKEIGFEEAIPNFKAAKVSGDVLLTLTDQDLAGELKITSALHRRYLLSEIAKLRAEQPNIITAPPLTVPTMPAAEPLPPAPPELGTRTKSQIMSDLMLEKALNCVVKIFCTSTAPHYSLPWQMKRQTSSTSSGFVIPGRRILGNAHGVTYQTSVRVRRHGDATKYAAKVLHVGHECDLCLLTVEDEKFWEGLEPLEFGDVPRLQESVTVVGYPTGGDNISVTRGVVSRVVVTHYTHSGESLLTLQTDSAINPGNSGGPAIQGTKVVGVAFETLTQAQNIGYVIPVPVIKHFLEDIERHGKYTGFPGLGITWQATENESLRKFYKIPPDVHGVLVIFVQPLSDASRVLRKGDVITAIDGVELGDDGTYLFRRGERISLRHLTAQKFLGDECELTIWRDGGPMKVTMKLGPRISLVPLHLYDQLPSYFVHAGLVFTVLSRSYLYSEWGKDWAKKAPIKFVDLAFDGVKEFPDQEVVILTHVLVDDVTIGYQNMYHLVVEELNGVKIRNLRHLVQLVEEASQQPNGFLDFRLEGHRQIVLDCKLAEECTPRILAQNGIAYAKSPDLRSPVPVKDLPWPQVLTATAADTSSTTVPAQRARAKKKLAVAPVAGAQQLEKKEEVASNAPTAATAAAPLKHSSAGANVIGEAQPAPQSSSSSSSGSETATRVTATVTASAPAVGILLGAGRRDAA